jgi:hypothetical protein
MRMLFEAIGGMKFGRGNRSTWRKPTPVPLCPPQNPTWQTRSRTPDRSGGKPATNRLSYGAALGVYFHGNLFTDLLPSNEVRVFRLSAVMLRYLFYYLRNVTLYINVGHVWLWKMCYEEHRSNRKEVSGHWRNYALRRCVIISRSEQIPSWSDQGSNGLWW